MVRAHGISAIAAFFLVLAGSAAHSSERDIYPSPNQAKTDLAAALAASAANHKRVLLDFGGNWLLGCALIAVLAHVYIFYGFESCGDIAEETKDAGRQIPKAMRWSLIVGGITSFVLVAALLLAIPAGRDGFKTAASFAGGVPYILGANLSPAVQDLHRSFDCRRRAGRFLRNVCRLQLSVLGSSVDAGNVRSGRLQARGSRRAVDRRLRTTQARRHA